MERPFSRRTLLWTAATVTASGKLLFSQQAPVAPAMAPPALPTNRQEKRAVVSVVSGGARRKIICDSLVAIEDQILPVLKTKKSVVIKPNIVNTRNQLASTHVDALHGILDFLAPRFKGPVVIAESSAGFTTEGYDNFRYGEVVPEHKPLQVSLVDLNEEGTLRNAHDPEWRSARRAGAAGSEAARSRRVRHLLGDAQDPQHCRGHPVDQKHGAGRSAAQPA